MIIVTLAGEKGGIGKTTLAFHLACYLAQHGARVLAVDLDPQGNLTYMFTGTSADGIKRALLQEWPLMSATQTVNGYGEHLRLLGGNKATGNVRTWLAAAGSPLNALSRPLSEAKTAGFNFVILDTPPSPAVENETGRILDALNAAALYATHFVLAPVILEQLPLGGLAALSGTLKALQSKNSAVMLLGVVPMMFDARTAEHAQNLNDLVGVYGKYVYPVVSRAIAVSRCPAYGKPVWNFEPRNPVSEQLIRVAERMVSDVRSRVTMVAS